LFLIAFFATRILYYVHGFPLYVVSIYDKGEVKMAHIFPTTEKSRPKEEKREANKKDD